MNKATYTFTVRKNKGLKPEFTDEQARKKAAHMKAIEQARENRKLKEQIMEIWE